MEKVKLGVVGLNFGGYQLNSLVKPPDSDYIDIPVVCDTNRALADRIAAKHGLRACYDLDELLADKSIEAIALFTNPVGRAGLLSKIIRAGKDVMTTKPFELDPAAARAVLEEAAALGRVIHINSPPPMLGVDLAQIRKWHTQYDLGRPIAARADVWTAKRDKADGSWLDDPVRCAAAPLTRVGIYLINTLVRLFGQAKAVQVMHSRLFTQRPTPDNAQMGIMFESGAIANVFASFCIGDGTGFQNALTLNYERGTIYWDIACLGEQGNMMLRCLDADKKQIVQNAKTPHDASGYQWDAFQRAVRGQKLDAAVTIDEIVGGVKVLAAMGRSEKSGRMEEV